MISLLTKPQVITWGFCRYGFNVLMLRGHMKLLQPLRLRYFISTTHANELAIKQFAWALA